MIKTYFFKLEIKKVPIIILSTKQLPYAKFELRNQYFTGQKGYFHLHES